MFALTCSINGKRSRRRILSKASLSGNQAAHVRRAEEIKSFKEVDERLIFTRPGAHTYLHTPVTQTCLILSEKRTLTASEGENLRRLGAGKRKKRSTPSQRSWLGHNRFPSLIPLTPRFFLSVIYFVPRRGLHVHRVTPLK